MIQLFIRNRQILCPHLARKSKANWYNFKVEICYKQSFSQCCVGPLVCLFQFIVPYVARGFFWKRAQGRSLNFSQSGLFVKGPNSGTVAIRGEQPDRPLKGLGLPEHNLAGGQIAWLGSGNKRSQAFPLSPQSHLEKTLSRIFSKSESEFDVKFLPVAYCGLSCACQDLSYP